MSRRPFASATLQNSAIQNNPNFAVFIKLSIIFLMLIIILLLTLYSRLSPWQMPRFSCLSLTAIPLRSILLRSTVCVLSLLRTLQHSFSLNKEMINILYTMMNALAAIMWLQHFQNVTVKCGACVHKIHRKNSKSGRDEIGSRTRPNTIRYTLYKAETYFRFEVQLLLRVPNCLTSGKPEFYLYSYVYTCVIMTRNSY